MENKLFEGRWRISKWVHGKGVILENVYNGNTLNLSTTQYRRVCEGNDTISHIITRKIPQQHNDIPVDNSVVKKYKRVKYKYANK